MRSLNSFSLITSSLLTSTIPGEMYYSHFCKINWRKELAQDDHKWSFYEDVLASQVSGLLFKHLEPKGKKHWAVQPVSSLKPDCSVDSLRTSTKACNWSSGVPAIYLSLLGLKWRLCKWRTKVDGVEWRLFYTSSIVFTFPFAKSAVSS